MIYCMRTRIFFSVNNTDFLFTRIVKVFLFTRNIADSHGFSFSFLVPNFRIFEFLSSVILRDIPCDYKKIRKFANSQIRDREKVS